MFAHCAGPAPDPRATNPDVPERCAAVALKAMALRPADRYANAVDMLAALVKAGL
jgi:hypothetical protein